VLVPAERLREPRQQRHLLAQLPRLLGLTPLEVHHAHRQGRARLVRHRLLLRHGGVVLALVRDVVGVRALLLLGLAPGACAQLRL